MVQRQLYHEPGPLAQIGQLWIVESMPPGELRAGENLCDAMAGILHTAALSLPVIFRKPTSATELLAILDELHADVIATGRSPILDIECHGNQEGLGMADGSFVTWERVKPKLEAINLACRFNLILLLGCCHGGYFASTTRLHERSAFCAYVGPTESVAAGSLYDGFLAFYQSLFKDRDLTTAMQAMRAAVPGIPTIAATAMGFFRLAFASYIRNWNNEKTLLKRAKAIREKGRREKSIQEWSHELKERTRPEFERCRRIYFAIDLFPENDARYALNFEIAQSDAAKPDRAGVDAY
jgi:hypothetical protein